MYDAVRGARLNEESLLKLQNQQKNIFFATFVFSLNYFLADHLQLSFENMPVQELILLILAEEVRRHVGTARQWNHCPVVTLNNV